MTKRKTPAAEEKSKPKPKTPTNKKGKAEAEAPSPAPPPKATPKATPKGTPKDAKTRKQAASNPPPAAEPAPAPAPVPVFKPESSELERKRLEVAEDLRKVETQVSAAAARCPPCLPLDPLSSCCVSSLGCLHPSRVWVLGADLRSRNQVLGFV
jgi:hypothetical protein